MFASKLNVFDRIYIRKLSAHSVVKMRMHHSKQSESLTWYIVYYILDTGIVLCIYYTSSLVLIQNSCSFWFLSKQSNFLENSNPIQMQILKLNYFNSRPLQILYSYNQKIQHLSLPLIGNKIFVFLDGIVSTLRLRLF